MKRPDSAEAVGIKGEREPIRLTCSTLIPAANPIGLHRCKLFLLVFIPLLFRHSDAAISSL